MSEHTPGPWFVVDDEREGMEDNRHICRDEAGDHRICFMATGYDNEADAALIAAAPALLLALEHAADLIHSYHGDPNTETGWDTDESCDAWLKCRAAIALASPSVGESK